MTDWKEKRGTILDEKGGGAGGEREGHFLLAVRGGGQAILVSFL